MASRRAVSKTATRSRALVRKTLRSRKVVSPTIKRRVKGQKGRIWLGANTVGVGSVAGLVKGAGRSPAGRAIIAVDGKVDKTAFRLRSTGQVFRRNPTTKKLTRVVVELPGTKQAIDVAREDAELNLLDNFEQEARLALLGFDQSTSSLLRR